MRFFAKKNLIEFWEQYPDSEDSLKAWLGEISKANWITSANIKAKYGSASILRFDRVIFNICGHKYRLGVKIDYQRSWVFLCFILTHKEYDKIDAEFYHAYQKADFK